MLLTFVKSAMLVIMEALNQMVFITEPKTLRFGYLRP